jgi:hypothetical protein
LFVVVGCCRCVGGEVVKERVANVDVESGVLVSNDGLLVRPLAGRKCVTYVNDLDDTPEAPDNLEALSRVLELRDSAPNNRVEDAIFDAIIDCDIWRDAVLVRDQCNKICVQPKLMEGV